MNIHIFCAIRPEADAFIDSFGLKPFKEPGPFKRYVNDDIALIVTGSGKIRMAAAVSYEMTGYRAGEDDLLINAGSCCCHEDEGNAGDIFIINKAIDRDSKKESFPDMLFDIAKISSVIRSEHQISSVSEPVREPQRGTLYDMEASSFFQTSFLFTGPHNTVCFKAVSDHGDHFKVDSSVLKKIMEDLPLVTESYIKRYKELMKVMNVPPVVIPDGLILTEYMKNSYIELAGYLGSAGLDIEEILKDYSGCGRYPANDKKETGALLDDIRNRFIK